MDKKEFKFNWQLYLGIVLVVAGGLFLADQLLPISIMAFFWPLLVVFLGVTFFIGMLVAGRRGSGLAIPGTIVTTIGLLLFLQNTFNLWVTWSYAWALLICATGLGILIMNFYLKRTGLRRVAGLLIGIGLTLFVVFGLFFEIIINISGTDIYSGIFLGGGLILLGLFIVFSRSLFKRAKPDFEAADTGSPETLEGDFETVEEPASEPSVSAVGSLPEGATFTSLRFKSFGKVFLAQGDACDLKIEGSEEQLERVKVDVEGDTLVIRFTTEGADWIGSSWMKGEGAVRYYVTAPEIEGIDLAGAGDLRADTLKGERLTLKHGGAGKLELVEIDYQSLDASLSGLGEIRVAGVVQSQKVDLSGAGSYEAVNLQSQDAEVVLSGAGAAQVWAEATLNAILTGAGSIKYKGNPTLTQSKSGIGEIKAI
ncbi:DUF2807 domain-containing protein [bacterium]|nr:DUF2807 domain-containing protein [bacterium]